MDLEVDPRTITKVSIPHTRGDGPLPEGLKALSREYSPHAWGWTCQRVIRWHTGRVFPTRVGMDRFNTERKCRWSRIPHTRGDGPILRNAFAIPVLYSPHAWGWTADDEYGEQIIYVFPTRVGMDRLRAAPHWTSRSIPHTRGDGPNRRNRVLRLN